MMGLGLGLLEQSYPHYPSTEGRGNEFGAYLMPGLPDFPEITSVIVENPSADGPFGAKAIGEMANNAQGPAICSAIHDAVGVWVPQQPATPERVLRALHAKAAGTDAPRREGKTVDLRRGHQRHDARPTSRRSSATSSGSDGRQSLPHLERRPDDRVPPRRPPARDRRRAGLPLQGDVRARQAGAAALARAHRAGHGDPRGRGHDDDRRRDQDAQGRATSSSSTAASSTR